NPDPARARDGDPGPGASYHGRLRPGGLQHRDRRELLLHRPPGPGGPVVVAAHLRGRDMLPDPMASTLETYTHGHHESVVSRHRKRTASEAAAFLLPDLKPGMRLLDVGCGPGSITLGLAAAVAPAEVLAIDLSSDVLEEGRRLAIEKGVRNVRFERADVDDLAQPDGAFDVVYAHQVLQHVREPVRTLQAMKRVLARGGLVAVRDSDYGTCTWSPPEPRIG